MRDAGRGGGVEAEHRAQHDGLRLVAGQAADQSDDRLGFGPADDVGLDVDVVRQVHEVLDRVVGDRPAPGVAQVVEGAVAADRGDPPAEAVSVAAEPVEVAEGLRPGLTGDVLGLDGQEVETVNGATFTVNIGDDDSVSLTDAAGNEVNVVATDVQASNGIIHVIDAVLMPA